MAKDKTGDQILNRVRKEIDDSFKQKGKKPVAHKSKLVAALKHRLGPLALEVNLKLAGIDIEKSSREELNDFMYALDWSRAWGKPISEYYQTYRSI